MLWKIMMMSAMLLMPLATQAMQEPSETAIQTSAQNGEIDDQYVQRILSSNDVAAFNELIRSGLDVNSKDADGNTMLFFVLTHNDDLTMAENLIKAGADVNMPSANGMTPIIVATSKANELILQKMMLDAVQKNDQAEQYKTEARVQEIVEQQMVRAVKMLEMLMKNGADINQETPMGTPLMNAATNDMNLIMVKMLLEAGANVNQQDRSGRTALFYARMFQSDNVENLLIKSGADVDIKDKTGLTYLETETSMKNEKDRLSTP